MLVGMIVVLVAVVIMWGLDAALGSAMPALFSAQIVLTIVATLLACFVVAAGCFVLFLGVGLVAFLARRFSYRLESVSLKSLPAWARRLLYAVSPNWRYQPGLRAYRRNCRMMESLTGPAANARRRYLKMTLKNAKKTNVPHYRKYRKAYREIVVTK
jgi:predicted ferric reductase